MGRHIDSHNRIWRDEFMPDSGRIQKVTAHLPAELLAQAQAATGKGITETLRGGLAG